jgi:sporulation protein YlmC with PRC-barrel domain
MMKTMATMLASVMALGLATAAMAQQTQPREMPREQRTTFTKPAGAVETKALIGAKVKSAQGKDIGEIDQLLVDPQKGSITHAVVGVGGMLGVGETHVVVPWSDVKLSADPNNRDRWIAQMDQSVLDRAPKYDRHIAGDRDRDRTPATSPRTEPSRDSTTSGTRGSGTPGTGTSGTGTK